MKNINLKYPLPLTQGEVDKNKEISLVRAAVRIAVVTIENNLKKCLFIKGIEMPGGAIDPKEFPELSAIRELQEETGYLINIKNMKYAEAIPVIDARGGNWIDLIYYIFVNISELEKNEHYEFDCQWIDIQQAKNLLPKQTFNILNNYKNE